MSEMSVDQVLMEMRRLTAAAQGGVAEAAGTQGSGESFATLLKQSVDQVNDMPALLSENDVLKAVQLLPGVQSAEGASTGFYVRGGSSDQNLILLNDAVIYNPFHAAGFISIFNGDIVRDISIHKTVRFFFLVV